MVAPSPCASLSPQGLSQSIWYRLRRSMWPNQSRCVNHKLYLYLFRWTLKVKNRSLILRAGHRFVNVSATRLRLCRKLRVFAWWAFLIRGLTVSGFRDACTTMQMAICWFSHFWLGIVHQTKTLLFARFAQCGLDTIIPSAINTRPHFCFSFSSSGKLNNACCVQTINEYFFLVICDLWR